MMQDIHILNAAQKLGWNTEDEATNAMLVKFGRSMLHECAEFLDEWAGETDNWDEKAILRECANAIRE